ncbi:PREDICTED: pollen-specific leucine-rich repeat extensin-like protein 1 [Tarenaya hassleriana]|uniref:pollen-specific leucine-rich repeat extensin-like protein 1 n=1 Tax=Tarenaya hassleriana TaxID=28532 RepID=UPI00053C1D3D|nr:PREDICTED: pollen-specific leucine-rich repeat extensin-like protein 1 [Tarenaya hassleriana]XP_010520661.1 PREDICTED: pollen-specific leucine-rich repeat extensin-like protein 1 [Tarenaya hassleriana]XP_010520668.1 PREDICTED: pollen-specific leucine-rich repeat extensin-like protein 1 [Tarenaya hassleriana]XP_010520674.1 PREDICTED: pollen-specific leucine-rich repeat extensin-like protein 1 [Tarenaya hassleriana]
MEKFSYNSYPDSADSSPRSREIEFDNPPPWEDQQQQPPPQSYKVKFMCSYGGKIQPRPHDNQLTYVGGETKILSVDRGIRFPAMVSKLSAIVSGEAGGDVTFKYQLPGEDLDALISVTNDDDLEHMMHEYDRLIRMSSKPPRMRLFLFPASSNSGGFGSEGSTKSDRDRFVEALNSVPSRPESEKSVTAPPNNADFLFGSENGLAHPPPPPAVKVRQAVPESVTLEAPIISDQPVISPDHGVNPAEIQRQLQEFQRLQIRDQEQQQQQQQQQQLLQQQQEAVYRRKSKDGLIETGGYFPPAFAQNPLPGRATLPQQTSPPAPAGFWQGNHIPESVFPATTPGPPERPVYMIQGPAPGTVYYAPPPGVMRPMATGQCSQGQRMTPDAYREQPAYNMVQPPPPQQPPAGTQAPPPPYSAAALPRPVVGSGPMGLHDPAGYTQVAYDGSGMGKQVYYTAPGGAMFAPPQPQYHGISVPVSGINEVRTGQDGKVAMAMAPKVSQSSDST